MVKSPSRLETKPLSQFALVFSQLPESRHCPQRCRGAGPGFATARENHRPEDYEPWDAGVLRHRSPVTWNPRHSDCMGNRPHLRRENTGLGLWWRPAALADGRRPKIAMAANRLPTGMGSHQFKTSKASTSGSKKRRSRRVSSPSFSSL